jgi:hypothetical protein
MKIDQYLPPILLDLFQAISRVLKRPKNKKKSTGSPKAKISKPLKVKKQPIVAFGARRVLLVLLSFALAAKGQWTWIQISNPKTLWMGCWFYLAAVILFLIAMQPWKREGLQEAPLSPKVEWTFFGLIMMVAVFFRFYKIDYYPNGLFMDQGLMGWSGLRILHEGWRPTEEWAQFGNPVYLLYQLAAWFLVFKPTQFNFYLFFILMGLATLPLVYWTLRQLAGSRVALLTLYFLASMRWNFNFARNGFPSVQVPFYMFGTIAFLLYGLKNQKPWPHQEFPGVKRLSFFGALGLFLWSIYTFDSTRNFPLIWLVILLGVVSTLFYGYFARHRDGFLWVRENWAFVTAAVFCSLGTFYTYQALKVLPILLVLYAGYEFFADRERLARASRRILSFAVIFLIVGSPMIYNMVKTRSIAGTRESGNSIMEEVRAKKSLKPILNMVTKTLMMANRTGDDNSRHNFPNYRMLDDVSGVLFVLGVFYALYRIRRRKYFYAVTGVLVMSVPCILSVVPAHANRMLGVTAFVCFLVATPLAALWGRVRHKWGAAGEVLFLLFLLEPLFLVSLQNYKVYFEKTAKENGYWNTSFWEGYSYDASVIGKAIAAGGDRYDYYLFQRHFDHSTIRFLSYFQRDHVFKIEVPAGFAPLKVGKDRGLFFAFLAEQDGFMKMVQSLYPGCETESFKDLSGRTLFYVVRVSAKTVSEAKGLRAEISGGPSTSFPSFPAGLPPGPLRATFKGSVFIDQAARYGFETKSSGTVTWSIGSHSILPGTVLYLPKGFYPVEISLHSSRHDSFLELTMVPPSGKKLILDNTRFTALDFNRGLHAKYYDTTHPPQETLALDQWDPIINFVNGTDFPYTNYQEKAYWEGTLIAPKTGVYQFKAITDEFAEIKIDGKVVVKWGPNKSGSVSLLAGPHRFEGRFQKVLGPSLTFSWIPPGQQNFEIIPNSVFGRAQ